MALSLVVAVGIGFADGGGMAGVTQFSLKRMTNWRSSSSGEADHMLLRVGTGCRP